MRRDRQTGRTNSFVSGLRSGLPVGAAVDRSESEGGGRGHVGTVLLQEEGQVGLVRELVAVAGDTNAVVLVGGGCGGDAVERLQASGGDGVAARGRGAGGGLDVFNDALLRLDFVDRRATNRAVEALYESK